jgi:hypothetical protein
MTSIRGENINSTDITKNTMRSKRLLDVTPQESLVVPEAINVAAGGLQKYSRMIVRLKRISRNWMTSNWMTISTPPLLLQGILETTIMTTMTMTMRRKTFHLTVTIIVNDRKLPADPVERDDNDDNDKDRKHNDDDNDNKERKRNDDDDNDKTKCNDNDDNNEERKRNDDNYDDNKDYAEISEVDVSDDDDGYIVTKKVAGHKHNSGGPNVLKKGSVPEEVYQEALKALKKFNNHQRYEKAKASSSSIDNLVNVEFTGAWDNQLRPMTRVRDYQLEKEHTFPLKEALLRKPTTVANT